MGAMVGNEEFFLHSESEQLEKIYWWARAQYVAPWAVFFGVLLRVAASTPPWVQLPAAVGGRASLNLLCAFVGASGDGKGASDSVARLAWPGDILELPLGSGEGIAAQFVQQDGNDKPAPVIFTVSEVDKLAGITGRAGSILLAELKAAAMGEPIGQANAKKDTTRIVKAHTYRMCLSVGTQPGHANVILSDASGGAPQRFLWAPTTDPDAPDLDIVPPSPLDIALPPWGAGDQVVEIVYGLPEIRLTIRAIRRDRLRGKGNPLDGHAVLTRCKVAALLAIMHQRTEVIEWDWKMSGTVMAVSDQTRSFLLEKESEMEDNAFRERGRRDEIRNEGRERQAIDSVKSSVIATMSKGSGRASYSDLNSAMGKSHRRKLLPLALDELADEGRVTPVSVPGGIRYEFPEPVQGEQAVQGVSTQFKTGERSVQGEHSFSSVGDENRMSHHSGGNKVSCQKWYDAYMEQRHNDGHCTVGKSAVSCARQAGIAAGYSESQVDVAAWNWRKREREKQEALSAAGRNSSEREQALAV